MATLLTVILMMGLSLAALNGVAGAAQPGADAITCVQNELKKVPVTQPGTSLSLKCPAGMTNLWPAQTANSPVTTVGVNSKCDQVAPLGSLCPGASGTCTAAGAVTVVIPQLPKNDTSLYFSCQDQPPAAEGKATPTKGCSFQLAVNAYTAQGPQRCAALGSTINMAVVGNGGRTLFACGDGMTLNPRDPKKAFAGDCAKEENLKDLELTLGSDGYYALTATKKPDARTYCYLCAQSTRATGQGPSNCAILISVSAASSLAARSTVGLALSCVLAVLHFA